MMNFRENILTRVNKSPKRLVLPEGNDIRVLKAAEMIIKEGFTTELYVLGKVDEINKMAKEEGVSLDKVILFDPGISKKLDAYTEVFFEMRKHKGITEEEAHVGMKNPINHAAMMLKMNDVDAMVSGSMTPTSKTVRAALVIVKTKKGIRTVSGSFIMIVPNTPYGADGAFIYADCGVVPEPTGEQLADISIASADTARKLLNIEPIVALLSFSTKGSAHVPSVLKVRDVVEILKTKNVDFIFDGEMQFDAAIMPEIAKKKAPKSKVAGKANVLIFPDLNAGNITYKATQRLCAAEAYGPILQGLNKPVNDLSRGASPDDIFVVSAITVAQAGDD